MPIHSINEVQILDQFKVTRNKLEGMKKHLETLLQKKIRLESEIQILRKAIKNKEKHFALNIKTKVNLESSPIRVSNVGNDVKIDYLDETPDELIQAIEELCLVSQEIEQLIKDYDEE